MASLERLVAWRRHKLLRADRLICAALLSACAEIQDPQPSASSTADARSGELRVEIDGNEVTVQAHEVSLRSIVEEIANRGGLVLVLQDPLDERVDVDVQALPLSEALRRILREHSFALQRLDTVAAGRVRVGTLWVLSKGSELAESPTNLREGQRRDLNALDKDETLATLGIALADSNANARVDAVSALADVKSDQAAALLVAAALHDVASSVRAEAVHALGAIDDDARSPALRRALMDPNAQVRQAAISAIENIGGESSAQSLAIALNDADASVRAAAVYALGEIGGETAARLLRAASTDKNSAVRETAIEALK